MWHWLNQSLRLHKDFKVLGTVPLQSHWHFLFLLLPPLPEFIATLSVLGLSFGCGSILLAFHFAESSFTLNILVVVFAPHIPRFRIGL